MGKRGKPGELALVCGVGLFFVGPVVLAILSEQDGHLDELQRQGVVAEAVVTGHQQEVENYTQRGKPRMRTNYYLSLSYDLNAGTPYAEWQALRELAPSAYPAMATTRIDVGETRQEEHPVASRVPVVFVPGQGDGPMLAGDLQQRTSWTYHLWHYLAAAACMVLGMALTISGWRKWRQSG
ncbi:hypothetical protein [Alteraurantiacibacter buctensis]|uniref:DUF3592 domain-containing protein n=1 Tax=Alteraurantiacibacter buctensis TaxID=1503981 RepID=A0A844YY76_9SPHN|nr:hypothetical protein [Alteraurantiacibacter buctensis]MXO71968.1 hypothetical protein [Alteraurantiacibacter buctensis]